MAYSRLFWAYLICYLSSFAQHARYGRKHSTTPNSNGDHRNQSRTVKLIIGVFITAKTPSEVKNALRFNAKHHVPIDNCVVSQYFFAGKPGSFSAENETYGDVIQGNFSENMNQGKSFEWFRLAVGLSSSYNFILKMDADIAMDWKALCNALASDREESYAYFGRSNGPAHCGGHSWCPPRNCTGFDGRECWAYMSGGLYGLSVPLAIKMATLTIGYDRPDGTPEDLEIGSRIRMLVNSANSSVENVTVLDMHNGLYWCHHSRRHLPKNYLQELSGNDSFNIRDDTVGRQKCAK